MLEIAHIKMDKTGSPPLLANNVVSLEREGEPETTPLTIKNWKEEKNSINGFVFEIKLSIEVADCHV